MALKIVDNGYVPKVATRGWNNVTDWVTKPAKTVVRERLQTEHDQVIDYMNDYLNYIADTGAADAYVVTLDPAPAAYAAGLMIQFKAVNANTGASTLNVNALGVKSIKKNVTEALAANDILASQVCCCVYDGTNFQLLNKPASFKTSTFTRDISLDSGNQSITGIGFKPRAVILIACIDQVAGAMSVGFSDGVLNFTVRDVYYLTNNGYVMNVTSCVGVYINGGGQYVGTVLSFDDDGLTITWDKTNSPTGTLKVSCLAIR